MRRTLRKWWPNGRASPSARMLESERSCSSLEKGLHRRVVGQDKAISAVAVPSAVRGRTAGCTPPIRLVHLHSAPRASARPNLRKRWRSSLFDDENMMTRIDMSEYRGTARRIAAHRSASIRRLRRKKAS